MFFLLPKIVQNWSEMPAESGNFSEIFKPITNFFVTAEFCVQSHFLR